LWERPRLRHSFRRLIRSVATTRAGARWRVRPSTSPVPPRGHRGRGPFAVPGRGPSSGPKHAQANRRVVLASLGPGSLLFPRTPCRNPWQWAPGHPRGISGSGHPSDRGRPGGGPAGPFPPPAPVRPPKPHFLERFATLWCDQRPACRTTTSRPNGRPRPCRTAAGAPRPPRAGPLPVIWPILSWDSVRGYVPGCAGRRRPRQARLSAPRCRPGSAVVRLGIHGWPASRAEVPRTSR